MKITKQFLICTLCLLNSLSAFCQETTANLDARTIILKCIDRMGGMEKLRSVKTLYTELTTEMDGRKVTWVTKEMLPNKGAFQIVYNGSIVYQDWFDGQKGFETRRGEVVETAAEQLTNKFPRKNIFNELDYLDSSVYAIERMEDVKVKRSDCYKVKARFITGRIKLVYIEKKTFNIIREDVTDAGSPETSITYFSDFKRFGDIYFYGKMVLGDTPDAQVATVTRLVANELITERDFTK
ncbi:hypothetical protein KJS94_14370 [Flavihumibacter rivuli]|uniref:hypothetical protein n=1 Tax=Flavihumibacter rivuli TaxID=2838156 RepID=UPI001BDDEBCB|nr:hypothetical protein [Flavihumibacter rivuli]ULQ55831.1 hypothetical protein KJS94_14370 [Flavihumibacter rivuli]